MILPVKLWGRADPAAGQLAAHAHDAGLQVVVDACQALGTTVTGRQAGLDATVACFSTHELKLLSTGEGGFLATDDPARRPRAGLPLALATPTRRVDPAIAAGAQLPASPHRWPRSAAPSSLGCRI